MDKMESVYWSIIILLFIVAFVGLVYPIVPGVLFLLAGFLLYGLFFNFEPFRWYFWLIQGLFIVLLFVADYIANMIGIWRIKGWNLGKYDRDYRGAICYPFSRNSYWSIYWGNRSGINLQ
jgi:uncharacterized protein YqgC (DUF456 family)